MDYMHISGTELSSVVLSQTKHLKIEKWYPKVSKQGKAKWDGVNKRGFWFRKLRYFKLDFFST